MYGIYCVVLVFIFSLASCVNDPIIIQPFQNANIDKIRENGSRYVTDHYTIKNWRNTKENEAIVDSFVCTILKSEHDTIHSYFITFYKYSDNVNNAYYSYSKKLCELEMYYSHLYGYQFRHGLFSKSKGSSIRPLKPLTIFDCGLGD